MTDLTAFVRARLDEDEATARKVESSWRQIGDTGVIVASDGERAEECANGNWTGIAEHIVCHDPARVLAEVASKRRIIEIAFEHAATVDGEWGCCHDSEEIEAGLCHTTDPSSLELLRVLAVPFAGHPDYREEWKP